MPTVGGGMSRRDSAGVTASAPASHPDEGSHHGTAFLLMTIVGAVASTELIAHLFGQSNEFFSGWCDNRQGHPSEVNRGHGPSFSGDNNR